MRRVAITGMGAVSAGGCGVAPTWAAVREGRDLFTTRTFGRDVEDCEIDVAAVADFDSEAHFDRRQLPAIDPVAQYAVVAAREAVAQSQGALEGVDDDRAWCVIGSGTGGEMTHDEASYRVYRQGSSRLHPMTVPRIMLSAVASHVALDQKIRGGVFSVSSACASGAHAISQAFDAIRTGQADVALAGGSEACLTFGCVKGWQALHVLSPDRCRPFSANRRGLMLGEGAAVFVLEEWERANARGADILGELAGYGMSSDAGSITAPDAGGMARAMRLALAMAGRPPEDVTHINAHGTGTQANDSTEYAAMVDVFGNRAATIPVTATKSVLGHSLGAAGALELAVVLETIRHQAIPPTANYLGRDQDCPVDCVQGPAREAPVDLVLSNSFAFGGLNAVLAVQHA